MTVTSNDGYIASLRRRLDAVTVDNAPISALAKVLVQGPNMLQLSVYDAAQAPAIIKVRVR